MQNDILKEKLYTSTEVAEILGVSLRSIYRYLEEGKLDAAVKTATGRHRFTRQNINDFLYPTTQYTHKSQSTSQPTSNTTEESYEVNKKILGEEASQEPTSYYPQETPETTSEPVQVEEVKQEEYKQETVNEEDTKVSTEYEEEPAVDWLAKFRQAAQKYKEQEEMSAVSQQEVDVSPANPISDLNNVVETSYEEPEESVYSYYRSGVGGLKEVAQSLDKSAKNASLDYAFTMNAGLSLHKPIKPFSIIHAYIRPQDKNYFEKALQLTPSSKDTAQLCLLVSDSDSVYSESRELHGLSVVSNERLRRDLVSEGESDLAQELK